MKPNNSFLQDVSVMNSGIIIDTASLMENHSLETMIDKYKEYLIAYNKAIVVPGVVCQELVRHLASDNIEKKQRANNALITIRNNSEIFEVESADYSLDVIKKAFADQKILELLTSGLREKRQILITNDRKLSRDASNLNQLESCKGKKVSVYFLSHDGDICVSENSQMDAASKEKNIKKEPIYIEVEKEKTKTPMDIAKNILGTISIFGAGYLTCKYGSRMVSNTRKKA